MKVKMKYEGKKKELEERKAEEEIKKLKRGCWQGGREE